MGAGLAGLLVAGGPAPSATLTVPLVLVGFGLGALVPTMTAALLGSVDPNRSGVASGVLNTARQAGSVIGVALFGSSADGRVVPGLRLSLVVALALAVVTVALAGLVPRSERAEARRR